MKTWMMTFLATAGLAALVGCGGAAQNEATSAGADQAVTAKALKAKLAGTWSVDASSASGAPFGSLTLDGDGKYHAEIPCDSPGPIGCQSLSIETGQWSLEKSGPQLGAPAGAEQIRFSPDRGGGDALFFVSVTADELTLRRDMAPGPGFTYTKADDAAFDAGGDAGGDTASPSCDVASDCSGALPQNCTVCADGTSACSHWSCVNHACEIAVCE